MNANLLSSLEQQYAELETSTREDLARYSNDQLDTFLIGMMLRPRRVWEMFEKNPAILATLAAATIQRERLRRAEIAAMENQI